MGLVLRQRSIETTGAAVEGTTVEVLDARPTLFIARVRLPDSTEALPGIAVHVVAGDVREASAWLLELFRPGVSFDVHAAKDLSRKQVKR